MHPSLETWLNLNNIKYLLFKHQAVFTVPEAEIHCGHIPGVHCKNLFLKNKKNGRFYLITIPSKKRLDLKQFRKIVQAPKIRFAEAEDLLSILGLTPGSVSPLGLINDNEHKTVFFVDESIWNASEICCHPNINTETLQIPQDSFRRLINQTHCEKIIIKMPYIEEK
ncbi:prolyl-tRNA synthetase associated domain-containing protein [Candidatus Lokiarchaeum ossiferum]|uniref:prolyl-tRNA synthetase associated domain-containing protein n=1 Tax=Candidatus Lokiarchaeum ossiferum TaxID=2951803 RepID=UPI00352C2305